MPSDMHLPSTRPARRRLLHAAGAAALAPMIPGCATFDPRARLDEHDAYRLGLQAYVYGYPLIYFARMRHQRMTQVDAATGSASRWGAWAHRRLTVTPAVPGAPQTDTLYSSLWLDLAAEPYLLRIPPTDGRYWSVQLCDFFGTTYGVPNRRRFTDEAWIAIVGPQWQGTLPAEVREVYRSPMRLSFSLLRMFFASPQDLPRAIALQQQFDIRPLSSWPARGAWDGIAGDVFEPAPHTADPLAEFKTLQRMWRECPPPLADRDLVAAFAPIGLSADGPSIDALPPAVQRGLARAESEARAQVVAATRHIPGGVTTNGWVRPRPRIGLYDDGDYLARAATTLLGTVALPVTENVYFVCQHEPHSMRRLDGSRSYTLHMPRALLPQVGAFWSIHGYTDQYTVIPNAIDRYALGDRSPGLRYDADGGLTLHVQPQPPADARRANWLPTKPGEPFWLIARGYEPDGEMKSLQWPGPIVSVARPPA